MSAVLDKTEDNIDGTFTYYFTQEIPIPSYLLAISVGNLKKIPMGKRTAVISEPTVVDADAKELEDLDHYLDLAEGYMGTYIWGNYTIIVQPPSFPIGGMENPLLTFASPTIIVGDKS
jgi:leukotriene-A4 hydrolase